VDFMCDFARLAITTRVPENAQEHEKCHAQAGKTDDGCNDGGHRLVVRVGDCSGSCEIVLLDY
jgi:hypothetical protein